jgi:sterol desaturase/sphingolipid hydroxylase (fatty acid hydroxylase superfamily)
MQQLLQYIYYPFLLIATVVVTVLGSKLLDPLFFPLIPFGLIVFFLPVFIYGERFLPYRKEWNGIRADTKSDFLRTIVVLPVGLKSAEFLMPLLFFYPVYWLQDSVGTLDTYLNYGLVTQTIVLLLACEFVYYWFHRASHEIAVLWQFHAVHHGAQRVYWMNAGRFHLVEAFLSGVAYFIPVLFLAPQPEVAIMVISISSITGFLEHINVDFRAGWLNYIFNSAQLHRWHHSRIIKESNTNYGKVLVVWDILFRSYFLPKNRQVGDVGTHENDVPEDFIGQAKYPFKK